MSEHDTIPAPPPSDPPPSDPPDTLRSAEPFGGIETDPVAASDEAP